MLKSYHFSFIATALILVVVTIGAGFSFRTGKQYKSIQPKNMWKNEQKSGYVVFTSTRNGTMRDLNYEIYSMNPDGSEVTRLTDNLAPDYNPSISPDGQKIAFSSYRDRDGAGNYEIYIMNFDGSDQTRITHSPRGAVSPVWSPDGKRIAFVSASEGELSDIYVMNADGSDPINLTNSRGDDYAPSWSPDGTQIAFVSSRDDDDFTDDIPPSRIYIMNADGTDPQRLTDAETRWPSWSPDGTKIAFMYFHDITLPAALHILDLPSKTETVLDTRVEFDGRVAWSPDGQEILFASYVMMGSIALECEHGQLYRMSVTGSTPVQITFGASNGDADWKGAIDSPATAVPEDTATAEVISTPSPVETVPPTGAPELEPTEPSVPPTDTPEPVLTEPPLPPTDTPELESTEPAALPTGAPELVLTEPPVTEPPTP